MKRFAIYIQNCVAELLLAMLIASGAAATIILIILCYGEFGEF